MRVRLLILLAAIGIHSHADAPFKVVTSTTDLAWATAEIGKERIEVTPLLQGTENPHYVDTIPEYIRLVAEAKVVCIVGLELEVGWMPKVLTRSGNAAVQPGGRGYCDTGQGIHVLDVPMGTADRSMGDIHPNGNPHFWLSPKAFADAASRIRDALIRVDPAHVSVYEANYAGFAKRMASLVEKNRARLAPVLAKTNNPVLIEYHKEFAYFFAVYGIRSFGSIEEKPGVPPSAGRIAEVGLSAKSASVKAALCGEYAPEKIMARFSEASGIPHIRLPTSLQPNGGVKDYIELQNRLVDAVIKALSGSVK